MIWKIPPNFPVRILLEKARQKKESAFWPGRWRVGEERYPDVTVIQLVVCDWPACVLVETSHLCLLVVVGKSWLKCLDLNASGRSATQSFNRSRCRRSSSALTRAMPKQEGRPPVRWRAQLATPA